MSYKSMNFIGLITSEIKDFIDALSESEKDIILSMLEDTIKDLKGGRSDH